MRAEFCTNFTRRERLITSRSVKSKLYFDKFRGVATQGDDVLIFGSSTRDGETHVAMWRSTDGGESWRRLNLPAATLEGLYDAYATGAAIVNGVAHVAGVVDGEAVVWSSPLAEAG